jgi:16S rRNA (cytidine1402-2'-O)-methyltransferase
MSGIIYLIPVTLGGEDFREVIPEKVLAITRNLRYFIVEDIRSARRYLRHIDRNFPIDETMFFLLNEHVNDSEIDSYLEPVMKGHNTGILSEAGLPCIADPGSRVVALAHRRNIVVRPLSGPSSIILALISSGLNGQNFTFHGYLPVKPEERKSRLRELEKRSGEGYSQIFMETPYRNQHMFETIISTCNPASSLCIAADITLPSESVFTNSISEWKRNKPDLKDRMVIFILQ